MKNIPKLAVAAMSVVMLASANVSKAVAFDYTFKQDGYRLNPSTGGGIINDILFGNFSGTPGNNGEIGLANLSAFNASFTNDVASWDRTNLSDFNYNPQDGSLKFVAKRINRRESTEQVGNSTVFTFNQRTYDISVDSNSNQPGSYSWLSQGGSFVNGQGRTQQSGGGGISFETPQVKKSTVPEPSSVVGLLVAGTMGAGLMKKKVAKSQKIKS